MAKNARQKQDRMPGRDDLRPDGALQDLQDFSRREKSMELRREDAWSSLHAGGRGRRRGLFKGNPLCQ